MRIAIKKSVWMITRISRMIAKNHEEWLNPWFWLVHGNGTVTFSAKCVKDRHDKNGCTKQSNHHWVKVINNVNGTVK